VRDFFALIGVVCAYCVLAAIAWYAAVECSDRAARRRPPKRAPEPPAHHNCRCEIVHLPVISYPPIEQCTHPLHHRTLHVDAESDAQALDAITRRPR
jgi:hypothetical protein